MKSQGTEPRLREKLQLMSASEIERTLVRLAHEIMEKNNGGRNLALVGIRRRGVPLGESLAKHIRQIEKSDLLVGSLEIGFYRDDLSTVAPRPVGQQGNNGFPCNAESTLRVGGGPQPGT